MMSEDEQQIRDLIDRWAEAVHGGDMAGVLTDHSDDIVMFDVPPPYEGARGIDEYRETWPPFFEWQSSGARFELVSLDVTAGEDVAFAHALLLCGTEAELADNPENRLRLTVGLRKEDGRWLVAHEHHSFPDTSV
ncbi:nuclear transport factor 2 family protein [Rhodococcus opacus]|uniref:nuclear transport factor 2 family protein n=1 Tax=Rhodococcus opacus TaxID=37919 RepID=UPI001CECA1BC|nr:SgcJ/EcaC family oxidoreductase [Rhodococcus opacus]